MALRWAIPTGRAWPSARQEGAGGVRMAGHSMCRRVALASLLHTFRSWNVCGQRL